MLTGLLRATLIAYMARAIVAFSTVLAAWL